MDNPNKMVNIIKGIHGSIGPVAPDAEEAAKPTPLEDGHDDAVGRGNRQQIDDDRLGRNSNRAEHRHEQQKRKKQHRANDPRQAAAR